MSVLDLLDILPTRLQAIPASHREALDLLSGADRVWVDPGTGLVAKTTGQDRLGRRIRMDLDHGPVSIATLEGSEGRPLAGSHVVQSMRATGCAVVRDGHIHLADADAAPTIRLEILRLVALRPGITGPQLEQIMPCGAQSSVARHLHSMRAAGSVYHDRHGPYATYRHWLPCDPTPAQRDKLSPSQSALLAVVRQYGEVGATVREIAEATGRTEQAARRHLRRLIRRGYLVQSQESPPGRASWRWRYWAPEGASDGDRVPSRAAPLPDPGSMTLPVDLQRLLDALPVRDAQLCREDQIRLRNMASDSPPRVALAGGAWVPTSQTDRLRLEGARSPLEASARLRAVARLSAGPSTLASVDRTLGAMGPTAAGVLAGLVDEEIAQVATVGGVDVYHLACDPAPRGGAA